MSDQTVNKKKSKQKNDCCSNGASKQDIFIENRRESLSGNDSQAYEQKSVERSSKETDKKTKSIGLETYQRLFGDDKGLDAEWLDALAVRGSYIDGSISGSKAEDSLKYIGMTVGGIACGTVYLGGDGRLFLWDIFNARHTGVVQNQCEIPEDFTDAVPLIKAPFVEKNKLSEPDGANYVSPPSPDAFPNPFEQYFALEYKNKRLKFDDKDWQSVDFKGSWPIGQVNYSDSEIPLIVSLKAYSPFIPLNLKDSSLPVTVMSFTVENPTEKPQSAKLLGVLENAVFIQHQNSSHSKKIPYQLKSTARRSKSSASLYHFVEPTNASDIKALRACKDFGSMNLSVFAENGAVSTSADEVSTKLEIPPKQKIEVSFTISWHFPNLPSSVDYEGHQRHYINDFFNAAKVNDYVHTHFKRLARDTQTWVDTWNDSSLPQWLLDRILLTSNMLQSQTCYIFDDGRFWGFEGAGCCPGTCTHVWHYAQGVARLFPQLEKSLREKTDFVLMREDGGVEQRGAYSGVNRIDEMASIIIQNKSVLGLIRAWGKTFEPILSYLGKKFPNKKGAFGELIEVNRMAIDGQAGTVLRSYREHLISPNNDFLKSNWSSIKKAMQFLINFDAHDENGINGMLSGKQFTTWDAYWYGTIHAMCSLYQAALYSANKMALEMGDRPFAITCDNIYQKGLKNFESLYNGEFYEHIMDEKYKVGTGKGSFIDQILGEFWAIQIGKDNFLPTKHIESSLNSIWRNNYIKNVGSFRKEINKGRLYAVGNEGGVVMTTWPNGGLTEAMRNHFSFAYFNEVWAGQEHQLAATMIATGNNSLIQKGLAVIRTIHERYSPDKRNPYNEIECSDHYVRSNASHGSLLAASGFNYHGPIGQLGFDPKINPQQFKSAFTAAEGWGSYSQELNQKGWKAELNLKYGQLTLRELKLPWINHKSVVSLNDSNIYVLPGKALIKFSPPLVLNRGDKLQVLESD